jgi:hypothetical protein
MHRTGYEAKFMTPLKNCHEPIKEPQKGPKAWWAQMTKPPLPGKVVASSAVTRASGMLHMNGKMRKPRIAKSGPAAPTTASAP